MKTILGKWYSKDEFKSILEDEMNLDENDLTDPIIKSECEMAGVSKKKCNTNSVVT